MKPILSIILIALVASSAFCQKQRNAKITIPFVTVVDKPVIEWVSYPNDTTRVGLNIQTLSCRVNSKLLLQRIEILVNGLSTDVYKSNDFTTTKSENSYVQLIERTVTLRTGSNLVQLIVENEKGIKSESTRKIIVDPTLITLVRDKNDQTPPMIYLSNPANLRNDRVVVYSEVIKITGAVMDESGIQQVTVNRTVTPVKTNGEFVINLPLNIGETTINIEVKDVNQNISLKRFTIERKNPDGSVYDPSIARNYLLIVGINNYTFWPALNNAVSDAKEVSKILTTNYQFDSLDVTVLLNDQATRSNIFEALRRYIEKITPRDNLLIYYSGHGYFDKLMSEGYWVPVDGKVNDLSGYLSNSQILKVIENINSQHTLLVADACFSGSLFASGSRGYVEHVEKYKSRWGLASGRLEAVSDGSIGSNSPFAQSFIKFLYDNPEPKVPVSDMVQYVKRRVTELNDQTPIGNPLKGVGDEGGEFVFYRRIK
ncbi:MAG: caspase family protein [Cyclobacteriaceae bacterium]|nr:caspase family protein [Cyclobacteriaceae bacterium]